MVQWSYNIRRFIFFLIFPFYSYASFDVGHLVTGTTSTLDKERFTLGMSLIGYGITKDLTVGVSPIATLGYDFFNILGRYKIAQWEDIELATDLFYFKSVIEDSDYDQESIYTRLNGKFVIQDDYFNLYTSLGVQYFFNERSVFSLRPDPLGKWRTYQAKTYKSYSNKLRDFEQEKRDPTTISISVMPSVRLFKDYFINLEAGVLGINYFYPLGHFGASLNYVGSNFSGSFGISVSHRRTPYLDDETLGHPEWKFQYTF